MSWKQCEPGGLATDPAQKAVPSFQSYPVPNDPQGPHKGMMKFLFAVFLAIALALIAISAFGGCGKIADKFVVYEQAQQIPTTGAGMYPTPFPMPVEVTDWKSLAAIIITQVVVGVVNAKYSRRK